MIWHARSSYYYNNVYFLGTYCLCHELAHIVLSKPCVVAQIEMCKFRANWNAATSEIAGMHFIYIPVVRILINAK